MTRRNRRSGFTLFELLTVLAVLSVVTYLGVHSFGKMADLWRSTSAKSEVNAKCVTIFETIRGDFERVASSRRTGLGLNAVDQREEEKLINRHLPHDDQLEIPVLQRPLRDGPLQLLSVKYHIDREGASPSLKRSVRSDGVDGGSQLVAERVVAMNINYLDSDGSWQDSWGETELPAAVRISLAVGHDSLPTMEVSREAVFPIHVK